MRFGHLPVSRLVTHTIGMDRMEDAYEAFARGPMALGFAGEALPYYAHCPVAVVRREARS